MLRRSRAEVWQLTHTPYSRTLRPCVHRSGEAKRASQPLPVSVIHPYCLCHDLGHYKWLARS